MLKAAPRPGAPRIPARGSPWCSCRGAVQPVVACAVAWVVLDERLSATQLAGGTLVLVGVGIAETARTAGPGQAPEIPPT